jgi:transposase
MLEAGRSQRHFAHVLGVSQSVVSRMWKRFRMTGNVLRGHAGGRERSCPEPIYNIVLQARRQRFSNATTLSNDFQSTTGVLVSTQTVRNRLHDAGLRSRRPAIRRLVSHG